jgi:hypothetical protein
MTEHPHDEIDAALERRLTSAFDTELRVARADIERRPLRPAPRSTSLRLAAIALAVVVAISGGLVFRALGLGTAVGPPDSMPGQYGGETVLTVQGALDRLAAATNDRPLLVGGWLQRLDGEPYCDDHPLTGCKARVTPSVEEVAPALWVSLDGRPAPQAGWVVLRVHTHDGRSSSCTPELRSVCEEAVVVEAMEWHDPNAVIAYPVEPTPSTTERALPSTAPGDDPIPATMLGLPVTRLGGLEAASASLPPGQSVILGGWVSPGCLDSGLCDVGTPIYGGPGRSGAVAVLFSSPGTPDLQAGPVVLRVRPARDVPVTCARAPTCPPALVVEGVLWQEASAHALPLGAPLRVAGVPVMTVTEAGAAIDATDVPAPFLVGGWFRRSIYACPTTFSGDSPLIWRCDHQEIGEESFPARATSDLAFLAGGPMIPADGAVVLRVHAHDPLAVECGAANQARCETVLVVDEVVWSKADAASSPPPTQTPSGVAIPATIFGEPVLSPAEAIAALPGLARTESTLLVGGVLQETTVDCAQQPCDTAGSIVDPDDPTVSIRWIKPGPLAHVQGRVVAELRATEPTATLDRILWRGSAELPVNAPRSIDGPLVQTVSQAIARAEDATDQSPFLVGGWFRSVPLPCPAPLPGTPPINPLVPHCERNTELDEVPTPLSYGATLPAVDVVLLDADIRVPIEPVVLRVHALDPGAAECPPADRATCERQLVVEAVAWTSAEVAPTPLIASPPASSAP